MMSQKNAKISLWIAFVLSVAAAGPLLQSVAFVIMWDMAARHALPPELYIVVLLFLALLVMPVAALLLYRKEKIAASLVCAWIGVLVAILFWVFSHQVFQILATIMPGTFY